MTVGAGELLVVSGQWKTGFGGVIELGLIPVHRGMARFTLFAVAA